jgi:hypothetical protein
MHRRHPKTKFDEDAWYRKLLGPLLVACHSLWTIRNSERHGTEQSQKRKRRSQQLERDLHDLFRFKSTVLASDLDIFATPVSKLITLPPSEIEKWIKSRRPIILHSRREAIKLSITDVRLLPQYFPLLPRRRPARKRTASTRLQRTPPSVPAHTTQLLTEHFSRLFSTRQPRTRPTESHYRFDPKSYEQQPLQFGDLPT